MVNAVDFAIALTVVMGIWIGFRRGFGRAIFDLAALLAGLKVASMYYGDLAAKISLSAETQANQALVFALTFLLVSVALWFIGKLVYDATLISLDTFDPPLGAVLGAGMSVVVGHAIVKSLFISASIEGSAPKTIMDSALGAEFLHFPAYHAVLDVMFRLGQ